MLAYNSCLELCLSVLDLLLTLLVSSSLKETLENNGSQLTFRSLLVWTGFTVNIASLLISREGTRE